MPISRISGGGSDGLNGASIFTEETLARMGTGASQERSVESMATKPVPTAAETEAQTGAGGRQIPTGTDITQAAVAGRDVVLTIDRDIQWVAQRAIADKVAEAKAESGTVVVMDPRSGRVLALATAPSFDPGDPTATAAKNRGNRAVTEIYEPGSTSKVMTAAAVIEEGKANEKR